LLGENARKAALVPLVESEILPDLHAIRVGTHNGGWEADLNGERQNADVVDGVVLVLRRLGSRRVEQPPPRITQAFLDAVEVCRQQLLPPISQSHISTDGDHIVLLEAANFLFPRNGIDTENVLTSPDSERHLEIPAA